MSTSYETARDYVDRWTRVGPLLLAIQRQELRALSDEDHLRQVRSVLSLSKPQQEQRNTSGLVELQRLLHQWPND